MVPRYYAITDCLCCLCAVPKHCALSVGFPREAACKVRVAVLRVPHRRHLPMLRVQVPRVSGSVGVISRPVLLCVCVFVCVCVICVRTFSEPFDIGRAVCRAASTHSPLKLFALLFWSSTRVRLATYCDCSRTRVFTGRNAHEPLARRAPRVDQPRLRFDCQCGTKDYFLCVPPPAASDDEAVASEPPLRVSTATSHADSRGGNSRGDAVPSRGGVKAASRGGDAADLAATAASTLVLLPLRRWAQVCLLMPMRAGSRGGGERGLSVSGRPRRRRSARRVQGGRRHAP